MRTHQTLTLEDCSRLRRCMDRKIRQLGRELRKHQTSTLEECSKDYDVAWTAKCTFYTKYMSSGPLQIKGCIGS
ncbi:hypothetical protein M0802_009888 [Mischocyttarus mexicanus]|nr:hypothetical protein M0802_009888 [Mischocyttarus mexicanus]